MENFETFTNSLKITCDRFIITNINNIFFEK